ncbi:hypothetical protein [Kitasatospora sp. NPDC056184]|uniref:hypothetical protein n=1 Tax=Kitasatospora sp. NPDC056184 TaxID=3345738 RepID=UPI0035E12CB3
MALQRRSWARGENVPYTGHVAVAGPDGRTVGLSVVRLDVPGAVPKPKRRRSGPGIEASGLASDASGIGAVLAMVAVLGFLLFVVGRWLFNELTGRPHFAVLATAEGTAVAVHRTRRRRPALIAAAALADRIEREGATDLADLTAPGSDR